MGVYIKGMEMPKGQHTVTITICHDGYAVVEFRDRDDYPAKIETYQAVSVPPHGRLGDLDALMDDISASIVFSGRGYNPAVVGASKVVERIEAAPTIIPASEEGE